MDTQPLLRFWFAHRDILPGWETYQQQRKKHGAWCCPRCGVPFIGQSDWQAKTTLIETYNLVPGGKMWERRQCKQCDDIKSLPLRGENNAGHRNA